MAMERLSNVLRQTGDVKDEAIANGIEAFRKLRGRDIPIGAFLGIEPLEKEKDQPRLSRVSKNRIPKTTLPLYKEVASDLRNKILAEEFSLGAFLPSEDILQEEYHVSRGTLREGIRLLQEEGLLLRMQGRGTVVINKPSTDSESRDDNTLSISGEGEM